MLAASTVKGKMWKETRIKKGRNFELDFLGIGFHTVLDFFEYMYWDLGYRELIEDERDLDQRKVRCGGTIDRIVVLITKGNLTKNKWMGALSEPLTVENVLGVFFLKTKDFY